MSLTSYLNRYGYPDQLFKPDPDSKPAMIVVIPCYAEPELLATLDSLHQAKRPNCDIEVIVVINESDDADPEVHQHNLETKKQAKEWVSNLKEDPGGKHITYLISDEIKLPAKAAGVGLARKIGMDEALRRFAGQDRNVQLILSLDADCKVSSNYFVSIYQHFISHPRTPASSIYFEHPLEGDFDPRLYNGIAGYELHLRYYKNALSWSGYPFAYYTIGSCFAVRADVYARQGGMNKRTAGEDFYFLQKVMLLGGYSEINSATVYPSSRISLRNQFGTGMNLSKMLENDQPFLTFNYQGFEDLKDMFEIIPKLWEDDSSLKQIPDVILSYLNLKGFEKMLKKIRNNAANINTFTTGFYHWFSGLKVLQIMNYYREHGCADIPVETALHWLNRKLRFTEMQCSTMNEWLLEVRKLDRGSN